jgi:hypothetical protein
MRAWRPWSGPASFACVIVRREGVQGPQEELSNSLLGGKGAGLTFVVYGAMILVIARVLPCGPLALFTGPARAKRPLDPEPSHAA